jgi:hypothetical protein
MLGQGASLIHHSRCFTSQIITPTHILNLRVFISIEVKRWAAKDGENDGLSKGGVVKAGLRLELK